MIVNENFKSSFLERQNQDLKKELNLVKTKFYQLCKTKIIKEKEQIILEILTILDLPIED